MPRLLLTVLTGGVIAACPVRAADQAQFSREDLKRNSAAVTEVVRRQIVEQPTEADQSRVAMIGELLKRRPDIGGARTLEPVDRRSAIAGGLGPVDIRGRSGLSNPAEL